LGVNKDEKKNLEAMIAGQKLTHGLKYIYILMILDGLGKTVYNS